jgi:integrase
MWARIFEADQFEAVRKHLPEALRPLVTFAYLTRCRLKSEGCTFPFTAAIEQPLKDQLAEHQRLRRPTGWCHWCSPHDFRRTAVRNLERTGVPRSAAMAMVGHKTGAIYRRYSIVDAGVLREAAPRSTVPRGHFRPH